jgi:hypothetical protein
MGFQLIEVRRQKKEKHLGIITARPVQSIINVPFPLFKAILSASIGILIRPVLGGITQTIQLICRSIIPIVWEH